MSRIDIFLRLQIAIQDNFFIHTFFNKTMIRTESLTFQYHSDLYFKFPDIQHDQQSPLLILGPSGCGKTTLLHLLAGLLQAKSGNIFIDNTNISQLSNKALDKFRGQNIGIVFQQSHFVSALSVWDNLHLPAYLAKVPFDKGFATKLLTDLNILSLKNKQPQELSQGEQQRLALARALINKPKIILADEPSSSLDDTNCFAVVNLLQQQAIQSNAQLVIVTHDQRLKSVFEDRLELPVVKSGNQ